MLVLWFHWIGGGEFTVRRLFFVCFLSEVFARSVTETGEPCETSVLVIYCCNIN